MAGKLKFLLVFALTFVFLTISANALYAIDRDDIIDCAIDYAELVWQCSADNLVADCTSGWESDFSLGSYTGVAYDWGGSVSTEIYLFQLGNGQGAGSHSWHGILSCTTGVDCSGYVSQCWQSGRYTTSSLHNITYEVDFDEMLPGDVWNKAGSHVVIHSGWLEDGRATFYEATPPKVVHTTDSSFSYLNGYLPLRYFWVEDSIVVEPEHGTGTNIDPYIIESTPFLHYANTTDGESIIDSYDCSPETLETGPEIYYQFTIEDDTEVKIEVFDGSQVDIDLHLLSSTNPADCIERNDLIITKELSAGTYYIVADSWSNGTVIYAGAYSIKVTLNPDTLLVDGDIDGDVVTDGDDVTDGDAVTDGDDVTDGDVVTDGDTDDSGDCRSTGFSGWLLFLMLLIVHIKRKNIDWT